MVVPTSIVQNDECYAYELLYVYATDVYVSEKMDPCSLYKMMVNENDGMIEYIIRWWLIKIYVLGSFWIIH